MPKLLVSINPHLPDYMTTVQSTTMHHVNVNLYYMFNDGQINIVLRLVMFGILYNSITDIRDIVNWELLLPAIWNIQFRLL